MPYRTCPSDAIIARLGDKRQEIIDQVVGEFSKSELVLNDWKQKIVTYYELYSMVQKRKNYTGLANIFVPETIRAVETIVTQIYQLIFSQPNWFEYSSRAYGNKLQAASLTELTLYQMDENNFKLCVVDAIRQLVIAGLTVRKISWDFEEVRRQLPSQDGKPNFIWDTIKDTWTMEPVDLLTFHISDISVPYNNVQKAVWMGEQYLATKEWLAMKCKKGYFSRAEKEKMMEVQPEKPTSSKSTDAIKSRLEAGGFKLHNDEGKFELLERWGLAPANWVYTKEEMAELELEDDELVETVIVIGNRDTLLKIEPNFFWHKTKPYVVCPYVPQGFQLPGIGAIQIGQSLQEELNDTRNQVMDNKTLILATMWLKSRNSGINNKDLTIRANGVILTNSMDGLQALRPPVLTGVGVNIESVIKNDYRESVGAASNLQGIAQGGVDTATESTSITRHSIGRLLQTAEMVSELLLKPTLVFAEYNNYQFYDHMKVIRILGVHGVKYRKLTPEEIAGGNKDVIIRLSLDATENPAVLRQQFQTFFQGIMGMAPEQINYHWKSLDKLYGMFFKGHTLSELYGNPQPDLSGAPTPEEERDLCIAGQACTAIRGQNQKEYIDYLTKEFMEMKYSLTEHQFSLFTKLIQSHHNIMVQEVEEQRQQFVAQQMLMDQNQGNGGKQGNMINRGSTPNSTPHNTGSAPSGASIRRGIGA